VNTNARKPVANKYVDKKSVYNPAPPAHYSPSVAFGNAQSHGNNHGNQQNSQYNRRRPDTVRRDTPNQFDKLVKQNDSIIKLLKEIRDELALQNRRDGLHSPETVAALESNAQEQLELIQGDEAFESDEDTLASELDEEQDD
jgi:hypothetical protein